MSDELKTPWDDETDDPIPSKVKRWACRVCGLSQEDVGEMDLDDKDGRSLLEIHPDGNVPGTQGCIGVVCGYENQALKSLRDGLLRNNGEIILDVDYGQ